MSQNVVVRWTKDLPARRDECWFLMTDQNATAKRICRPYGQRMTIEQLFRESNRNGRSLRDTRISTPERLDRLLLVLAVAYLLLCGVALIAKAQLRPSAVVLKQSPGRMQPVHHWTDHASENTRRAFQSL